MNASHATSVLTIDIHSKRCKGTWIKTTTLATLAATVWSGARSCADFTAAALAGVGENVAHEVDPAALPGRAEHLGDGGLQAFVGVGDDQLDASEATAGQLA